MRQVGGGSADSICCVLYRPGKGGETMQKRSVRALGMWLGLTFGMLSAGVVTGGTFRVFSKQALSCWPNPTWQSMLGVPLKQSTRSSLDIRRIPTISAASLPALVGAQPQP